MKVSTKRTDWVRRAAVGGVLLTVLAAAAWTLPSALAQAGGTTFGFEEGTEGFTAISAKDGSVGADADATVQVAKEGAKAGSGALQYGYKIEPGAFRALFRETRLPAGTQSIRFWIKSGTSTALMLTAREDNGADYQATFVVPGNEWVQVQVNLDDFQIDPGKDPDGTLNAEKIAAVGLADFATLLANSGADVAKAFPNLLGSRKLWLDDFQLSPERAPQSVGVVKGDTKSSYLVDNFDAGVMRWVPVVAQFGNGQPSFELFPSSVTVRVQAEAAGPGMARTPIEAGGKGLRFTYTRGAAEVAALLRSLEREDLSKADRVRLSLNVSRKASIMVQIKEKDGSEYQYMVPAENSVGWQNLDIPFSDFALSGEGKDENNRLDPDQIKELVLLDASAFLGLPGGETTLELDAVSFGLK